MESIYKPWQWPVSILALFLIVISAIAFLFGISMLLYKPEENTFKEIISKIGYSFLGVVICIMCIVFIAIAGKLVIQSTGKCVVAIIGNYDVVEGYAENTDMSFNRNMYYKGAFKVNDTDFYISGETITGTAYIKGEKKAELLNNYPIVVKYKRIFGMNVIVSIDAITEDNLNDG